MKKYNKDFDYSYTFGTFPTTELINNKPDLVEKVLLHSKLNITNDINNLITTIKNKNINIEYNDKLIEKICDKGNVFVVGVFKKYSDTLNPNNNHIVLNSPSDFGNLGTIIRTCLGFNYTNIAIIEPCADVFNPKVVRASMGSIFSVRIQIFKSFDDYKKRYLRMFLPFMLQTNNLLQSLNKNDILAPHSLIFGNESSGLSDDFLNCDLPIKIAHSTKIDSLNLCNSVSIALYEFDKLQQ